MRARLKVWVEENEGLVLSDYRARMLELIDETGSLADAAARLGISYRRAWGKLKEIEANLGVKLVQSVVGGPGGGSTHLTPAAERLVAHYHRFRHALSDYAEREFTRDFEE